ncbi:MAG: molecular chaperone HtpG [Eubacteriales bacterium]|nr:molecular chaperone HtpG [Clostridiales bacterium]MDY5836912.1 molecular chaperone HtpG [Eubacteriales bacterium]
MEIKSGKLSVESENIFPIIKQWLYAEEEIFLRELVSNAVDAISKRKHLILLGEAPATDQSMQIEVKLDTETHTLTISDTGIGMTAEELDRYINQIAYSGLVDYVEKYKGGAEGGQAVIGHFGLGFYSAFMVADQVEIQSLSCLEGAEAVSWQSKDGLEYHMSQGKRDQVGTDVILHLDPEARQDYTGSKVRGLLKRYCGFMPYPIYFQLDSDEADQVNDPDPLWLRPARSISSADYIKFYQETFDTALEPLFWIHLNLDYPFRLKGILYFPSYTGPYLELKNRILIYSRQVFVSDDLREMIPDFLFLLQGTLDCPDLPLNVSRSYLQNDQTIRALSKHIVSKVGDKLAEIYQEDPDRYRAMWTKIADFVKLGSLQDEAFADKVKTCLLLEEVDGSFQALADQAEGQIYYVYDDHRLDLYTDRLHTEGKAVFRMHKGLDIQWMSQVEARTQGKYRFVRADSLASSGEEEGEPLNEDLLAILRTVSQQAELEGRLVAQGSEAPLFSLVEDEAARRFADMQEIYAKLVDQEEQANMAELAKQLKPRHTVMVNSDNPLYARLTDANDSDKQDLVQYAYYLALLAKDELRGEELKAFLQMSEKLWQV